MITRHHDAHLGLRGVAQACLAVQVQVLPEELNEGVRCLDLQALEDQVKTIPSTVVDQINGLLHFGTEIVGQVSY